MEKGTLIVLNVAERAGVNARQTKRLHNYYQVENHC
jgi:hypothetical protein